MTTLNGAVWSEVPDLMSERHGMALSRVGFLSLNGVEQGAIGSWAERAPKRATVLAGSYEARIPPVMHAN